MAETAAWLVDHVIPKVPVRQWVLSFPIPLRSLFAVHPELLAPVLQIIHRVIATHLITRAGIKRSEAATGAMTQALCANAHGFSLHAGVRCAADQRSELEHLCRYLTRPAIANERLSLNHAGQVVLKLKTPNRDGTSHLLMSPLEFMQRLAALVARPRLHLIRFHGVLAPHACLR